MYRIYEEPVTELEVGKFYGIKRQNFLPEYHKYHEYKPDEVVYGCFVCKIWCNLNCDVEEDKHKITFYQFENIEGNPFAKDFYEQQMEGFWVNNMNYTFHELAPLFKNAAAADSDTDTDSD